LYLYYVILTMSKQNRNILSFIVCAFVLLSTNLSAQVNANFSGSPRRGCAPLIVSFNDLSTGGPNAWNWNLGNSVTSFSSTPSTTYSTPGVYSVTLTVTNGSSTSTIVKPNYIVVYNKPTENFTASNYTVCVGQSITFSDATIISAGGPPIATWSWDFGDGNTQFTTNTSVTHAYNSAGNYPVSLIITDTNSCTPNAVIKYITVIAPPNASFTASPLFSCTAPLNVNFTNTSTSSGLTTYAWNFGNGNTSTLQNPTNTYASPGSYAVSLIVSQGGCVDTVRVPNQIVIQNINVSFAATPSVVCTGQPITFTNTSVPNAATANWNFGDGNTSTTISPVYTYTAAGTYTVTLSATDANTCAGNSTGIVTVNQTPAVAFTADTMVACSTPFPVTFTNTSTGATTYNWHFGDGNTSASTNPSNIYTAPGTYTVTLTATNSSGTCKDSVVKNSYIIISPPVANFTAIPDSGCAPLNVTFNSSSTSTIDPITTYSWTYGNGSSGVTGVPTTTNIYSTAGVFTSTLVVQTTHGCRDTFVCNNCIKTGVSPTANFIIANDTICYGLIVTFSDSSQNATGWHYMFGDGATSNLANPTHVYGDTGTFQVKLVVYNNGCSDTSVIKKVVVLPPKAVFTFTLSCTNYFTVNFTSQSEGADSLFWDFGDGSMDSSNNINPVHVYSTRGPKVVTLIAYNYKTGCNNTATASFTIAQPIASYTLPSNKGCYVFTPTFTSTSQDASTYYWNFGDPATLADSSLINNPLYAYNLPGVYTVSLIITDVNGCKNTTTGIIKSLGPIPHFYANILTGCRPLPVTFYDGSLSDSTLILWNWNFGDGSLAATNIDSIVHVYTTPGNYNVTMAVTDKNGCKDSVTINNFIQPTFPYPAFTLDTFACRGDLLTFDASTTSAVGPTYLWNFGDGTITSTTNPIITHSYTVDNLYTVTLKVTDVNGCDSIIIYKVRILKPTAHFSWNVLNAGCGTLQVAFQDSSQGFVNTYNWDFGNGANSNLQNPTYTYVQPGIYNASLIVTNAGGCKDTIKRDSIIVVPGSVGTFSFSPNTGCSPLTVTFVGNSGNAQQYYWDFYDGTTIYGNDSITHTYTGQGVFHPILWLINTLPNGSLCSIRATTLNDTITVTTVLNVSISPHIIVLPEDSFGVITTSVSNGVMPYIYNWTPSSNLTCGSCPLVQVMGTGDTVRYVYTVYDQSGCASSDTLWVYSRPCLETALIPNVFSPNGDGKNEVFYIPGVCPNEDFSLQIFDRWGSLLFNSVSRNHTWDGKTNHGENAPDGTYFFIVKVKDTAYKGFLQLVR